DVPIDIDALRDPDKLAGRGAKEYRGAVVQAAKNVFPGRTRNELAEDVFADQSIVRNLKRAIEKALRARDAKIDREAFYRPDLRGRKPRVSLRVYQRCRLG